MSSEPAVVSLAARIASVRADIAHILSELAARGIRAPVDLPTAANSRRGRPRRLRSLLAELAILQAWSASLHVKLIEARGEKVFSDDLAPLVRSGVIARPAAPKKRGRGRPPGARTADALVFWEQYVRDQHQRAGKPISTRKAYTVAQKIVNKMRGTHSTENRANLYRARRRKPS